MARKAPVFWSVLLGTLAVDQATKLWVVANIEYRVGAIEIVPGFFDLVHSQNPGAAFGLLDDAEYRMVVFAVSTLLAVGVLGDLYRRLPAHAAYLAGTFGLVLGGVLGNAVDRVMKQEVTDFLRFHVDRGPAHDWLVATFGTAEWPHFNVADSVLFIGLGLFLGHAMFFDDTEEDPLLDAAGAEGPSAQRPG